MLYTILVLLLSVNAMASQSLHLSAGEIHYHRQGEGETLILLHGFGASTFTWRENIEALSQTYEVYALDFLGFGQSAKPTNDPQLYSHQSQAAHVAEFMEAMGIDQAHVIGHSMGGTIGVHLALDHPQKVRSLVLMGSPSQSGGPRNSFFLRLPGVRWLMTKFLFWERVFRPILASAYYDPTLVTAEVLRGYLEPLKTPQAPRLLAALGQTDSTPIIPRLDQLSLPTLILWGEGDTWVPISHGRTLHQGISHSQLIAIPQAGHTLHEEQPSQVNQIILDFLEGLSQTGKNK